VYPGLERRPASG